MDLSLIQGTISGLKIASDLAKGFLDLKTEAEVQAKVIELQSVILNAQSSALAANADQSAMVDEIRALKEKLAAAHRWEHERARYKLVALEPGVFAYALRNESAESEPPHWLCGRCYNAGTKSILQNQGETDNVNEHVCPACDTKIIARFDIQPTLA